MGKENDSEKKHGSDEIVRANEAYEKEMLLKTAVSHNPGEYAVHLAEEYELGEEKIRAGAMKWYEGEMRGDRYLKAAQVAKKYGLGGEKIAAAALMDCNQRIRNIESHVRDLATVIEEFGLRNYSKLALVEKS